MSIYMCVCVCVCVCVCICNRYGESYHIQQMIKRVDIIFKNSQKSDTEILIFRSTPDPECVNLNNIFGTHVYLWRIHFDIWQN